jgi:hypothetical protein
MPPAVLISAALAASIVLPLSASAKEHRSASVKREFQLTHPCPSTGLTSGACPGWVKDHIVPLVCGGPDAPSNMQWQRSAMQRPRIGGRRRAALVRGQPISEWFPLTSISTCRLPQREQTSRSRQSSTDVSAPYRADISVRCYDRDVPDDAHGSIAAYRSVKPPPRSALSCDSSLTSDPRISCSRCRTIAVIATRSAAV